ncbi:two-component system, HptB-dependent secretion and biofilm response regulator [Gammaproteobacteria bacterium]
MQNTGSTRVERINFMTERRYKIMLIDDLPANLRTLGAVLSKEFDLQIAKSGETGLALAEQSPPDLILLDVMMPGMDGYETCRRFKENTRLQTIPIIFITAANEVNDELQGLALGAVDYITKPFSIPIVQARVKTHLALQTAKRELDKKNQLLLHERESIETILLKMRQADVFDERYLRYIISPVEKTAGDMLLSAFTPDGRQLVLLGDFTGHGLSAAIGGPLVTYILHELAKKGISGEQILHEINYQLYTRLPTRMFLAAILLDISLERTQATLWNAGLPDVLLIREGSIQDHFPSEMIPLGISKKLDIGAVRVPLKKGDRLYAFSNGIIEAKDSNGNMFGMDRLEIFLKKVAAQENVLDELMALLNKYVKSSTHEDDITLVEVQI